MQKRDECSVVVSNHAASLHHDRTGAPTDGGGSIAGEMQLQLGLGKARAIRPGCAGCGLDRGLVGTQGRLGGVAGGDQLIDALSGDYAK